MDTPCQPAGVTSHSKETGMTDKTNDNKLGQKARAQAVQALIAAHAEEFSTLLAGTRKKLGFVPKRVILTDEQKAAVKAAHDAEVKARAQKRIDKKRAELQAQLDALALPEAPVVAANPFEPQG